MKASHVAGLAAIAVSIALWSAPARAQSEGQRRRVPPGSSAPKSQPKEQPKSEPKGQTSQPRTQREGGERDGGERRAQPRQPAPPPPSTPSGDRGRARDAEPQRRAVPRGRVAAPPRARAYPERRSYGYRRPRVAVPVIVYPRRYYAFRPRYWIGYGLFIGVPVPYPLVFGAPTYIYPDVFASSGAAVQGAYGGISFDVTPADADVVVDGVYVGVAADFSPNHQPLTLTPGRHHVELQAPGLAPVALDVDIAAGQVVPFQGMLVP